MLLIMVVVMMIITITIRDILNRRSSRYLRLGLRLIALTMAMITIVRTIIIITHYIPTTTIT